VDPNSDGETDSRIQSRRSDDIEIETVLRKLIANLITSVANAVRRISRRPSTVIPCGIEWLGKCETCRFLGKEKKKKRS
jgi:hypothetical protein